MNLAPIALFVYNRPDHTRQTVEALSNNEFAQDSDLYIFSDASKTETDNAVVNQVRAYIKTIRGFQTIHIRERKANMGLAESIIAGVTEMTNSFGRVIVLEDDLLTSPFFLRYMNEALELYAFQEEVISIHGYVYPIRQQLPETFFIRGADCWGWATWKRGWDLFEPDGRKLLHKLEKKGLMNRFDFNGAYPYVQMLKDQINGKNHSWAIRWYASAFLKDRLTLYPGVSLIQNIGLDSSGTHRELSSSFMVSLRHSAIELKLLPVVENEAAVKAFGRYFRSLQPGFIHRNMLKAKKIFSRLAAHEGLCK